ncbi:MAG: hypothetical protein KY475_00105 [Planctomycetes bacterium]|nr:hypothetical protein [Planctomycetota bacterium]
MNSSSFNDAGAEDQLHWTAYRYTADELAIDEREAFELRLADDQSAREAVAKAVELLQATHFVVAESRTVERSMRSEPHRISWSGWVALGAAACLLVILGLQQGGVILTPGNPHADVSDIRESDQGLAMAWTQTRHLLSQFDAQDSAAAFADELDDQALTGTVASEDEVAAPTWMLAALAGMGQDSQRPEDSLDNAAPAQPEASPSLPDRQEG